MTGDTVSIQVRECLKNTIHTMGFIFYIWNKGISKQAFVFGSHKMIMLKLFLQTACHQRLYFVIPVQKKLCEAHHLIWKTVADEAWKILMVQFYHSCFLQSTVALDVFSSNIDTWLFIIISHTNVKAAGLIAVLKMNQHARHQYAYLGAESSKQLNIKIINRKALTSSN